MSLQWVGKIIIIFFIINLKLVLMINFYSSAPPQAHTNVIFIRTYFQCVISHWHAFESADVFKLGLLGS
jgi:hypothetical protein